MEGTGWVLTNTPSPRSRNSQLLDLCEHIVASLVVDVDSLGVTPRQMGSPSGYTSDRSGPGAGRPSSNRLGISRALLCRAIDGSSNEDHLFQLAAEGLLPSLIG